MHATYKPKCFSRSRYHLHELTTFSSAHITSVYTHADFVSALSNESNCVTYEID